MNGLSSADARNIDGLMPGFQLYEIGDKLKSMLDVLSIVGKSYYLDPVGGDDSNTGESWDKAVKTLTAGYAKLRDGYNDVLYYIAGTGSISLSAKLTWAKSYAHLVGVASPVVVGCRARIFQTASATGVSPLIDITGSGCIFKNLYIFHGVADATSLICVRVTGQRNYFENVHFAGIGNATQDAAGAASLKIDGGAENLFKNCFIGLDTQGTRGANSTELWFDSAATRNRFEDCTIYGYISNAGHALVTIEDAQGIDRYLIFKNCVFMTDSLNQGVTITQVFNIKAAIVQGKIILQNCMSLTDGASGSGAWDGNSRGIIFSNAVAPAATAGGGIATKK